MIISPVSAGRSLCGLWNI